MLIFGAEKSALFNLKKWQTFFRNESMKKNLYGKQTERFKHIFTHLETVYCYKTFQNVSSETQVKNFSIL